MSRRGRRRSRRGGAGGWVPYVMGTAAAAVVVVVLIVVLSGGGDDGGAPLVRPSPQDGAAASGDEHVLGDPEAPVSLVEYEDLQCPHCAMAAVGVLPQIEQEFPPGEEFSVEARPIAILGEGSKVAAQAAECADEQGRFWDFRQAVYLNQQSIDFSPDGMDEVAALLELDQDAFGSCVDSGKYGDKVQERTQAATERGVQGVPTTFVNGRKVASQLDQLRDAIQEELAAAR